MPRKLERPKNLFLSHQSAVTTKLPLDLVLAIGKNKFIDSIYSLAESTLFKITYATEADHAAFMLMDSIHSTLMAIKIYSHGQILDGEEHLALDKNFILERMISKQIPYLQIKKNCAYFLLHFYGKVVGMIRIEKDKPLHLQVSQKHNISEFLQEVSACIWSTLLNNEIQMQGEHAKVLSEIHNAVSDSLNVEQLLSETTRTVQNVFGMDRVKIYILDVSQKMLLGQIACDFRGEITAIPEETFPLKAGLHPAVDMILNIKNQIASQFDSIIQMIPIHTRNEKLGVLMVDNLLSQEEISEETITLLKMVSIQIGLALKNARLYKKVEELSVMDSLTGLYVQRHFHQRIREELSRAHRHHTPVSLVMLDIDHFKIINDTYGHPAGDRVMKVMSSKITSSIRKFDVAVRYGGDEFIVLMPGSNETETLRTAERIRKFVNHSSVRLETGKDIHFSCSIGVASFPEHANTDEELIQKADQALYEAKKLGRNRVVAYTKQPKLFPPNP